MTGPTRRDLVLAVLPGYLGLLLVGAMAVVVGATVSLWWTPLFLISSGFLGSSLWFGASAMYWKGRLAESDHIAAKSWAYWEEVAR